MKSATSSNYEKHTSTNPIQQFLIAQFYKKIFGLIKSADSQTILDAGCGEGFTLNKLIRAHIGKKHVGFDASKEAVVVGKKTFPGLFLEYGDIYHARYLDRSFDLVLCSEVLEHLNDPKKALSELCRVSKTYVLLTVPWEPWFWITNFFLGKYRATWGNHPEHINHWTSKSFRKFVHDPDFHIVHASVSFPWIIILVSRNYE